jgi:hypothetical protein
LIALENDKEMDYDRDDDSGFAVKCQRITISQVLEHPWFKKGYNAPKLIEDENVSLEDVVAVFDESKVKCLPSKLSGMLKQSII